MLELTTEEKIAFEEYERIEKQFNDVAADLENLCLERVKKYTEAGDFESAREYMNLMPQASLARIYVADHIRWARGDYDKD